MRLLIWKGIPGMEEEGNLDLVNWAHPWLKWASFHIFMTSLPHPNYERMKSFQVIMPDALNLNSLACEASLSFFVSLIPQDEWVPLQMGTFLQTLTAHLEVGSTNYCFLTYESTPSSIQGPFSTAEDCASNLFFLWFWSSLLLCCT